MPCKVAYVGATPGADSNVYELFSSLTSQLSKNFFALTGIERVVISVKHSQAGTLKWYKSTDRGVTWHQIYSESVAAPVSATITTSRDYPVSFASDWKIEWTNGGVAQATWVVDVALEEERAPWSIASLKPLLWAPQAKLQTAGTLTQWPDVVRGNNVAFAGAARPTVNMTGGPNGGPCVTADGIDDVGASLLGIDTTFPLTIMAAAKWDSAYVANSTMWDMANGNVARMYRSTANGVVIFGGGTLSSSAVDTLSWAIWKGMYAAGSSTIFRTGVSVGAGNAGSGIGALRQLVLFAFGNLATDFAALSMAEIVVIGAMSPTEEIRASWDMQQRMRL